MKIRKRAEQQNVTLNKEYYIDKDFNQCYEPLKSWEIEDTEFRIFTEDLEELKVALDEYGHYTTVAVGKSGNTYYVNL